LIGAVELTVAHGSVFDILLLASILIQSHAVYLVSTAFTVNVQLL
jgi:hypothetical protein